MGKRNAMWITDDGRRLNRGTAMTELTNMLRDIGPQERLPFLSSGVLRVTINYDDGSNYEIHREAPEEVAQQS
jgi:hypothetical protein